MSYAILTLIMHYSMIYNVSPVLAIAVAQTESGMDVNAVGPTYDIGLFQLNRHTFRKYTKKQLFDPETNIRLGIEYLAIVKDTSIPREGFEWVINYNLGSAKGNHVKHAKLFPYYIKVKEHMDKLNEKLMDGDKVTVKGMYNLIHDGEGIYRGKSLDEKDMYLVENEYGHRMRVHPDRIKKCLK